MRRRGALLGVVAAGLLAITGCSVADPHTALRAATSTGGGTEWDAGNIFSDAVFYNSSALKDEAAVQAALDLVGSSCDAQTCLRTDHYAMPGLSNQWCTPVPAEGSVSFARMLFVLAHACGLNPQVAIVMIQKESQGLTRTSPPAALTGWGCPDSGPGGSANCNGAVAGVWQQTSGLFVSAAHGRRDASVVARYVEGQAHNILWNVAESGCGGADVLVQNRATAWIYTYTPYQPNAASLAAYPGEGDACSSYGNRNLFELFQKYFGSTGGGKAVPGAAGNGGLASVGSDGVNVTIPNNQFVDAAVRGKTIQAPTDGMAKGIAAGFGALGMPYVWGGGGDGSGPNDGCARGGGQLNSCQGIVGFDCSGLTAYVLVQGGYPSPGGESGTQRSGGVSVGYDQGRPGDIVGFPGHVAIYLGTVNGQAYILEASDVGVPIHIVPLNRSDKDASLHRYWSGSAVA